jgi:hypothetical protein
MKPRNFHFLTKNDVSRILQIVDALASGDSNTITQMKNVDCADLNSLMFAVKEMYGPITSLQPAKMLIELVFDRTPDDYPYIVVTVFLISDGPIEHLILSIFIDFSAKPYRIRLEGLSA